MIVRSRRSTGDTLERNVYTLTDPELRVLDLSGVGSEEMDSSPLFRIISRIPVLVVLLATLSGSLARPDTIVVNSTADNVTAGDGNCTLREAIMNANLPAGGDTTGGDCVAGSAGTDTIALPAGTYRLTIGGTDEDLNAIGDLDITDSLTITGRGTGVAVVDAAGIDRVFHIVGAVTVGLNGVTVTGDRVGSVDSACTSSDQANQLCQGDDADGSTCGIDSINGNPGRSAALGDVDEGDYGDGDRNAGGALASSRHALSANNNLVSGSSIVRANAEGYSEWKVGDSEGSPAAKQHTVLVEQPQWLPLAVGIGVALAAAGGGVALEKRHRRRYR
jgi:CSLREA domain-containing protein